MDPKPRLIQACQELRRKVYASLPWGIRLARALFELRFGGTSEDFGRTAYGLFLMYGVTGMPETKIVPKNTREINKLPKTYGSRFGKRVEGVARKFVRGNDADLEDLMAFMWSKLFTDQTLKDLVAGKPLDEAERIVMRSIQNVAKDWLRYEGRRRHEDIDEMVNAPGGMEQLNDVLLESEKEEIMSDLERAVSDRLAPDLPLYFQLLLEGYTNSEIADKQMLPSLKDSPMSHQALAKYRKKIEEVLLKHIEYRDAA